MIRSTDYVTLHELIDANSIDISENGIWEEIGLLSLSQKLPVYRVPTAELMDLGALSAQQTVWSLRNRATRSQREVIAYWKKRLSTPDVGLGDVIVLDSDRGDSPITIDGHHRIVAAIQAGVELRAVDFTDLE